MSITFCLLRPQVDQHYFRLADQPSQRAAEASVLANRMHGICLYNRVFVLYYAFIAAIDDLSVNDFRNAVFAPKNQEVCIGMQISIFYTHVLVIVLSLG